jgi:hypothetical protein
LLGDASLYQGKYYLYFGPVPSLFLIPFTSLFSWKPGDQVFVYIFIIGLFFAQGLIYLEVFRRYFPNLPGWIIPLGIFLLGLTGPFTRMLSHPFIHEAAISGGQFFSTAGLYLAFLALQEKPIHVPKLFWASIFWAFALGTRTTQLIPISSMVLVTWLFILLEGRKAKSGWGFIRPTFALATPLLVVGILLAWYNWVRFDSIFEFGLYYQLAAFNLQANYDALFSRVYVIQNIYNYFFNPFEVTGNFPFIFPIPGREKPIFLSHELPKLYAVEGRFAGLLVSTPFLLFSILPLLTTITNFIDSRKGSVSETQPALWNWIIGSLIASFIGGAIPTLLIFYVGFRYETEFITSLSLLAILGFCQSYRLLKSPVARNMVSIACVVLNLFSIYVNIALSFNGIYG